MPVTVSVLPDDLLEELTSKLKEYATLEPGDGNMVNYLYEREEEGVEVRAFPTGGKPNFDSYPVEGIEMEIIVDSSVEWHEPLGEYSADNLSNGGPVYQALAEELEGAVEDAGLGTPAFVKDKGSGAFTETIDL